MTCEIASIKKKCYITINVAFKPKQWSLFQIHPITEEKREEEKWKKEEKGRVEIEKKKKKEGRKDGKKEKEKKYSESDSK